MQARGCVRDDQPVPRQPFREILVSGMLGVKRLCGKHRVEPHYLSLAVISAHKRVKEGPQPRGLSDLEVPLNSHSVLFVTGLQNGDEQVLF